MELRHHHWITGSSHHELTFYDPVSLPTLKFFAPVQSMPTPAVYKKWPTRRGPYKWSASFQISSGHTSCKSTYTLPIKVQVNVFGLRVKKGMSQLKLCSYRSFQGSQEATGDDVADDAVWNRGHWNDSGADGISIPQHVRREGGAAVQDCAALGFYKRLEAGRDPLSITLLNAFRVMSCGGNLTHKKAIQSICTYINN